MPDNANFNKQLAMTYLESNNMAGASDAYEGYLAKLEAPDFNDYSQQATFSFYAGVESKQNDPAKAEQFFTKAYDYATKMEAALPGNYRPYKIYGDIAMQRAASDAEAKTVAFPQYSEAALLIEKSENPSRYARDAKTIYNYLGNYYLDQKDVEKAKENFNKYLQYDPDNEGYRKFVEGLK